MNQADLQGIHTIQRALYNHRDQKWWELFILSKIGLRRSRLMQMSKAKEDYVVAKVMAINGIIARSNLIADWKFEYPSFEGNIADHYYHDMIFVESVSLVELIGCKWKSSYVAASLMSSWHKINTLWHTSGIMQKKRFLERKWRIGWDLVLLTGTHYVGVALTHLELQQRAGHESSANINVVVALVKSLQKGTEICPL